MTTTPKKKVIFNSATVWVGHYTGRDIKLKDNSNISINHKFVDDIYNSKCKGWQVEYKSKYIQNNRTDNSCLYTVVIDMWNKSFQRELNIKLIYEKL